MTIVFPFYNDAGTVQLAIDQAYKYGKKVTKNLEVIALHGGNSKDETWSEILKQKQRYPRLKILNKKRNTEGYAVIKHGLKAATKDWVFYTDGDLQYKMAELPALVRKVRRHDVTVVNGYKISRGDNLKRELFGSVYQQLAWWLFQLPIQDIDCDFRLIKTSLLKKIRLEASHSSVLPELIKKLEWAGAHFAEVPVLHLPRRYGHSNYRPWKLAWEKNNW